MIRLLQSLQNIYYTGCDIAKLCNIIYVKQTPNELTTLNMYACTLVHRLLDKYK